MKVKVDVGFLYSATYMVDQEHRVLQSREVEVDWRVPLLLQRKCSHPLPALTDSIGSAVAANKPTTAPINHTRPSPP